MAKYRKIPIIVDAIQYTGELKPVKDFLGIKDAEYDEDSRKMIIPFSNEYRFYYFQGDYMVVAPTNYVLKHEDGSFEVITAEEFNQYEEITTPE